MWIVDRTTGRLYFFNPNTGNIVVSAASPHLERPTAVGFTAGGDMLIADYAKDEVYHYDGGLVRTTVLTAADGINGPGGGNAITISPGGDIYIANYESSEVLRFDSSYANGTVVLDATDGLVAPRAFAFLANGDLLIGDRGITTGAIYRLDTTGTLSLFYDFGDIVGGERPTSIAIRSGGDIYVLTALSRIYRLVGGDPANRVFLGTYGPPSLRGSINFSFDNQTLYHVSQQMSILTAIDPVSGASSLGGTLPSGGTGTSMFFVGNQYPPGSYAEFDEGGVAGTGGFEPKLSGVGEPRIGSELRLEGRDLLGDTLAVLFVGTAMDEVPFAGGQFFVDLTQPYYSFNRRTGGTPGQGGTGGFNFNRSIPEDPTLIYINLWAQVVAFDTGATMGMSVSPLLRIYFGE